MKTTSTLPYSGIVSSLLLTAGLTRAASKFDTSAHYSTKTFASVELPAPGCETPCNLIGTELPAPGCETPCNLI